MTPFPRLHPRLHYIDADDSSNMQSSRDHVTKEGVVYTHSFDSSFNILMPQLVDTFEGHFVRDISCGADFSIITSIVKGDGSQPVSRTTSISIPPVGTLPIQGTLPREVITSCRYGNMNDLQHYLLSEIHKGTLDLEATDKMGNTALIIACQNGHYKIGKMLIDQGANVNARNNKGNSPLHFALTYSFEELSKYLIAKGADEYVTNREGLTPYEGLSVANISSL